MNSERDANRIVRSWLEAGSTGIPDRVLDAVLSELPSTPQRRPRWSPWRFIQMKPVISLAAGAAIIVLAVVLGGRFLPSDSGIGVPTETSSPLPSPSATAVGGQFSFAGTSVDMNASSDGSTLSGTVAGSYDGKTLSIDLQCLRQFDGQTWMLAGVLTKSAVPNQADGSWAAVIVRDGSPQQAGIYVQAQATAEDCEEFVREIPDSAVEGFEMIAPMDEGRITLPPSGANPISGRVTFPLGDQSATVDVDASAIDSSLTGTATVAVGPGRFTIGLECSRMFDDTTWILGGEVIQSTSEGQAVGARSAVIARDGSPQQVILWFEDPSSPAAAGCPAFVNAIPDEEVVNGGFVPVDEGEISLPASLGG